eukprot:3331031-Pleurochrysis_carterae.AAC.1
MRCAGRVAGEAIVLKMVSISCRSTLASCSGEMTKWSFSSEVKGRTPKTGAATGAAVAGAALAGVDRVVGPEAAALVGAGANVNVGAMGEGASMEYGVCRLKKTACACW